MCYGYLFPAEIQEILDAGCRPLAKSKSVAARLHLLLGWQDQSRWWFYFLPGPDLRLDLRGKPFETYNIQSVS